MVHTDPINLLHALVRDMDVLPPGFVGSIGFGIEGGSRSLWWRATLCDGFCAEFVEGPPPDVDLLVALGPMEAEHIMRHGRLPRRPASVEIAGATSVVMQIIEHYCSRQRMPQPPVHLEAPHQP